MRDGALEQVGPADGSVRSTGQPFVASFIGSPAMNIWPGTMVRAVGERALVGVRPHDIELTPTEVSDRTGRVEILEPLGPTTLVHVRIDDAPESRARIVVPAATRIAIGDHVGFSVRRDRLHFFDEKSGRRPM